MMPAPTLPHIPNRISQAMRSLHRSSFAHRAVCPAKTENRLLGIGEPPGLTLNQHRPRHSLQASVAERPVALPPATEREPVDGGQFLGNVLFVRTRQAK